MTGGERTALGLLTDFVQDWRDEDREWKQDTGARLRAVEDYITAERAVTVDQKRVSLDRRAKIGVAISALSGLGALILSVLRG